MDQDRQFSRLISAQFFVAILAGGAFFLIDSPFEPNRKPSGEYTDMFEARLWEDPLNTIYNIREIEEQQLLSGDAQGLEDFLKTSKVDIDSFSSRVSDALDESSSDGLSVIAVMMPEGQHSLTLEMRRRTRYAVISALNQSKIPVTGDRLSLVALPSEEGSPDLIGYEVFQPYTQSGEAEEIQGKTTIVLWVPAKILSSDVVQNYQRVLTDLGIVGASGNSEAVEGETKLSVSRAILLGPNSSDELVSIYRDYGIYWLNARGSDFEELASGLSNEDLEPLRELILRTSEIADDYLDFGFPMDARESYEACMFSRKKETPDPLQTQISDCLAQLSLQDSDETWFDWVAAQWNELTMVESALLGSGLTSVGRRQVTELVEAADWYLDDGLFNRDGDGTDYVVQLVACMDGELEINWNIDFVANCLNTLGLSDSDETWHEFVAESWVVESAEPNATESANDYTGELFLTNLIDITDSYLDVGFSDANRAVFRACVASEANPELQDVALLQNCLTNLNIADSDPDWVVRVLSFLSIGDSTDDNENSIESLEGNEITSAGENPPGGQTNPEEDTDSLFPRELIVVLSPRSTIPDEILKNEFLEKLQIEGDLKQSIPQPPELHRMLDSDDVLLSVIHKELLERNLRQDSKIALIYEGDSKYGRALQQILDCRSAYNVEVARAGQLEEASESSSGHQSQSCFTTVESFSYLRGLDGIRPEDNGSSSGSDEGSEQNTLNDFIAVSQALEEPFGRHQFDYLRRLSEEISRDQYDAIGVLGTDVFDKLLVLQALREKNKDAVFFTTDLDATLLHPSQFAWTQNLLVASALPLSLSRTSEHQGNSCSDFDYSGSSETRQNLRVAPFRESYQTAYFHSVCLARVVAERKEAPSHEAISELISANFHQISQLYELGRSGPVLLPSRPEESSPLASSGSSLNLVDLAGNVMSWALVMTPTLLLLVLSGLAWNRERYINRPQSSVTLSIADALEWSTVLCLTALVLMAALLISEAWIPGGEPLLIWEGVSHWPTTLFRIQILVFSITFGLYSYARWLKSTNDIEDLIEEIEDEAANTEPPKTFELEACATLDSETGESISSGADADSEPESSAGKNYKKYSGTIPESFSEWLNIIDKDNADTQTEISIGMVWKIYRSLGDTRKRLQRVRLRTLVWTGIVYSAYLSFTAHPALVRESYLIAELLFGHVFALVVTFASLFLISIANDVANLGRIFVRALAKYRIVWDKPQRQLLDNTFGGYDEICQPLCVLELIAQRTRDITPLVIFPFGTLLLVVVSRSKLFEGWSWGIELAAAYSAIAAISLAFALLLQKEAAAAKRQACSDLRALKIERKYWVEKQYDREHFHDCVDAALVHADTLNKGAFVPWFRHPIFQALLLPFTGTTGLLILQSI
ncbi:MAG: hypothetical protein DHS20C12_15400 [Pseudohongiella sp.]|nr:MAG: hypothetical protein DHS20C12_15400 [Pseudohongiella sp.]